MISNLLIKLSRQLYGAAADQELFMHHLTHPTPYPGAILWCHRAEANPFTPLEPLPWQPDFIDRLPVGTRPGKHELHDRGFYYCLDTSSVFAASILLAIPSPIGTVIDLCASPGGKSIFAWRGLSPSYLYCNEVIGKRSGALIANLKRCHIRSVAVLRLDTALIAEALGHQADVVIVDAPCTGQSLLAKGEKADGCFHPTLINKNAQRQRRILANASRMVAPSGHLAYMTCTFSPEENEETVQWFLKKFPQFELVTVPVLAPWQSHLVEFPCYRLMPHHRLGAGAFTALFTNTASESDRNPDSRSSMHFLYQS